MPDVLCLAIAPHGVGFSTVPEIDSTSVGRVRYEKRVAEGSPPSMKLAVGVVAWQLDKLQYRLLSKGKGLAERWRS